MHHPYIPGIEFLGAYGKAGNGNEWKPETETGNGKQKWKCNLLAVVVIVFVPGYPSALPPPVFAILYKYAQYMS